MAYKSLRNTVGMASLTALALTMVACGGSSSSTPAVTPTNVAPSVPLITTGPTSAVTNHQYTYNLASVDPEGDAITYSLAVANADATISGSVLTYKPSAAGTVVLSVKATDSKGAASAAGTAQVIVIADRAPVFGSATSVQATGSVSAVPATFTYSASAVDPDSDSVTYKIKTGSVSIVDNTGAAVAIPSTWVGGLPPVTAAGVVSFPDLNVPSTKTTVVINFTVVASDVVTFGTPATSERVVAATYINTSVPPVPVFITSSLPSATVNHPYGYANNLVAPNVGSAASNYGGAGYTIIVRNLRGNNTTLSATGLPAGLSMTTPVSAPDPTVAGATLITATIFGKLTTVGSSTVTITATDTVLGLGTTQQFNLQVAQDQKPTNVGNLPAFGVQATQFHDPANLREKLVYQNASLAKAEFRFMRSKMNGTGTWSATQNMTPDNAGQSAAGYDSDFSWPLPLTFSTFTADATTFLDTYLGQQGAGWRFRALAPDAERDGVYYFIKPNSVNVDGSPFTVAGKTIPAPMASVFSANTEGATIRPTIGVGNFPGGIVEGGSPWGDGRVAVTEYPTVNASTGEVTWNPNTSAQWSFIIVAQEMVNGNPVAGQFTEIQVTAPVYVNTAPGIGTLTLSGGSTVVPGNGSVILGGGTSTSGTTYGLPAAQEPIANSTVQAVATTADINNDYYIPNPTPSIWRWQVKTPGNYTGTNDIGDNDSTPLLSTGHQDAWEMRVSGFSGGMLSLTGLTDTNVPGITPGQNVFQSETRESTAVAPKVLDSLFYNPWLSTNASKFELNWGPDREQYLVARFAGMTASQFGGYIQDEYGAFSTQSPIASFNILFGDIRATNSRYRRLYDNSAPTYLARGNFRDSSYNTLNQDLLFMYLPLVGTGATNETAIGPNLFNGGNGASTISGVNPLTTQYAASGQIGAIAANAFSANTPGSAAASNWITLPHLGTVDPLWTGGKAPIQTLAGLGVVNSIGYPANAINGNVAFKAAHGVTSISGTAAGETTYRQLSNVAAPKADDGSISLLANTNNFVAQGANDFSDNELIAGIVPHNSPYLIAVRPPAPNHVVPVTAGYGPGSDMALFPWFNEGEYTRTASANYPTAGSNLWYYGQLHSEVDFSKVIPGRGITLPPVVTNAQAVFNNATTSRIRYNFSWPTTVTAANMGVSSGPNVFAAGDLMQVATPQMGANGRYFFTGNATTAVGYNGTQAYNTAAAYSIYGVEAGLFGGATTTFNAGQGFSALTSLTFPVHALTNSIFVPWQTVNGAAGFPNSVTFTAGTNYTDVPLTGIKGIVDGTTVYANTPPMETSLIMADTNTIANAPWTTMGEQNNPAHLKTLSGKDRAFFIWMRPDSVAGAATSYATWGATVLSAGDPLIAGGSTTAAGFNMGAGLTDTNTELHFASGVLPGTNQGQNVKFDAAMWQLPQFWNLRTQVGHPTRSRQVRPGVNDVIPAGDVASLAAFLAPTTPDGLPLVTAIMYGVRDHSAAGDGVFGEQGIEPASPVLASWDPSASVYAAGATPALTGVLGNFYSPFVSDVTGFKHVMDMKFNFAAGVNTPGASTVVYRQLASIGHNYPFSTHPLDQTVTDPTRNDPQWYPGKAVATPLAVNFSTPVLTPVRQLKINDYQYNTTTATTRVARVYDLVNGNATDLAGLGMNNLGLGTLLDNAGVNKDSNLTLTWKQGQGDQVLPSGYVVTLYQVNVVPGQAPKVLGTYYLGHTYGNPATTMQTLNLPSINSLLGNPQGTVLTSASQTLTNGFYFTVRSTWGQQGGKRIDMDKTPYAVGIPSAFADYVSGVFIAQ